MIPYDPNPPKWMLFVPDPRREERKFNDKPYIGWLGRAPLMEFVGWLDNPRIDIPVEVFQDENLGREPDNDELLDIMIDYGANSRSNREEEDDDSFDRRRGRKNKLVELAESIRLNGVRIPLVVTHDKRILDGNRRYFASLYLYKMTRDEDERENYASLPVWVLPKSAAPRDEERILVELNSINDCYEKWPYSVIARRVYRDHKDGMTIDQLAKKYHDWTKGRIRTVIEASRVAEEFIEHHDDDLNAKDIAYRKLVWFDELRRSNADALKKEEFRSTIFDMILEPNSPFTSHKNFQRLGEIYENPEAWEVLTSHEGKEALRQAHFILERDRYEGKSDAQSRMKRINSLLKNLVEGTGFDLVEPEILVQFHELASQVPGRRMDIGTKIERMLELMNSLTSKEIAQLSLVFLTRLSSTLERVKKQAESYRDR